MQFKSTRETVWGWLGKKWALEHLHFTENKHARARARVQDNAFLLLLAILIFKKLILSPSINLSSKFSLNQFFC